MGDTMSTIDDFHNLEHFVSEIRSLNTYKSGHSLMFEHDITKTNMVALCLDLNKEFEKEGCMFEPEKITDGFLVFTNYKLGDYKCMRLHTRNGGGLWPWVPKDVMTSWEDDETVIFRKHEVLEGSSTAFGVQQFKNEGHHTFLKAFDSAPAWTRGELERFGLVFKKYGIHNMEINA